MSGDLLKIYQSLSDETRLRIVNLLLDGPLCVCHIQDILELPQVKVSRHLAYLRERGMVEVAKNANWRVYRLPAEPEAVYARNLDCIRDCAATVSRLSRDKAGRRRIEADIAVSTACCV